MSLAGSLLSAQLNRAGEQKRAEAAIRRSPSRRHAAPQEVERQAPAPSHPEELRRCAGEQVCARLGPQPAQVEPHRCEQEQQQRQQQQSYRSAAAKGSSLDKQAAQRRSMAMSMSMTMASRRSAGSAPGSRQRQAGARQLLLWLAAATLLVGHSLADYSSAQQQQQLEAAGYAGQPAPSPAKAKKIQIVYIKVPLNKLKPALNQGDQYAGSASAPVADNATASYNSPGDSTKSHGSQPEQQQPLEASRQQQQQPSFLIPMAVVQSEPAEQQRPAGELDEARPAPQRLARRPHQSPVQLYQQLLAAGSAPPHQGFMSSFLQAEKERLTSAALRLALSAAAQQPQPQQQPAPPQQLQPAASTTTTNTNPNDANAKPGGLMPVMMMPFSHMPDNMIGQAYNAAVGQALPLESDSAPAGSVIGKAAAGSDLGYQQQQQQQQATAAASSSTPSGGAPGTSGPSGVSPSTGSGGSYGASGAAQSEANSSASGYRSSASASGAYGPSSGFGSGTNSFGASVAFSDYPNSPASGYSSSSSSSSSFSTSPHLPYPSSPSSGSAGAQASEQAPGDYAGQRLRQAKKTIIPIVVQVEHAIMESNQLNKGANRYLRNQQQPQQQQQLQQQQHQRGSRQQRGQRQPGYQHQNGLYGSATQDSPVELGQPGQYINAANAQDINQITAQINAENAASAAAALAQADMAFGPGGPAYIPQQQQQRPAPLGQQRPQSAYAAGLQSAASALLANTHPVLQAAASGGFASVSKLGAKLGEMMALPSMQVPHPIAALPSALSSITSQVGLQLNQAVQQVAKEHPSAHAFARQVAQHAGLQLPNFVGHPQQHHQHQGMVAAASQPQQQSILASPQAQLQNLKLSIGQNLQSAAAQLIGAHQKGQTQQAAAAMLANPLSALYPPVVNTALKTLAGSGPIATAASGLQASASAQQPQVVNFAGADASQQQQQQSQQHFDVHNSNQHLVGPQHADQQQVGLAEQQQVKPAGSGKPTLKSKFLSFFQPPKFISNLLNWNERADERADQVSEPVEGQEPAVKSEAKTVEAANTALNATSNDQLQAKMAPVQVTDRSQATKKATEEQEAASKVVKVEAVASATNSTSATTGTAQKRN